MKRFHMTGGRHFALALLLACGGMPWLTPVRAEDPHRLDIIEEKLDKLRAELEALQFKQQRQQEQFDDLQAQVQHLRDARGGASGDVAALEAKIKAVDAAREKDKTAILDQLAKELAALAGGRPAVGGGAAAGSGREHVVQKGETLATIAKTYGVSIAELTKANSLADPNALKVGQKLVIPK